MCTGDFSRALERSAAAAAAAPRDAGVLSAHGELLAESGAGERAAASLREACAAAGGPAAAAGGADDSFEKYMYLSQVTDAREEARECLKTGVLILERLRSAAEARGDGEDGEHLSQQLCQVRRLGVVGLQSRAGPQSAVANATYS